MTDEQLAEIEERLRAATPGPWQAMRQGNQYIETDYLPTAKVVGASVVTGLKRPWNPHAYISFGMRATTHEEARFTDADADFIAHAPTDIGLTSKNQPRAYWRIADDTGRDRSDGG